MYNLFADLSSPLPDELVSALAENQHVRIERIVFTGHSSPPDFWYDQDESEVGRTKRSAVPAVCCTHDRRNDVASLLGLAYDYWKRRESSERLLSSCLRADAIYVADRWQDNGYLSKE